MAELHGRILRLPHRGKLALLALGVGLLASSAGVARAQSVTVEELGALAGRLGSPYADAREAALQRLQTLPEAALPAIEARVAYLGRLSVPPEDALAAVFAFRHATGSRRADDRVDIAPGIGPVLAERRDRSTLRMAERLALLRALERMGTPPATRRILDILALDPGAWRWERGLIVERMGARMLPALVEGRGHASPDIRRWTRDALEDLGLNAPGRAIQQDDPVVLADLLRAYGASLDFDAMEVVAPFVGHDVTLVREAAREAMERFGRNGIWQLRIAMRNQLGREADPSWGWQRTMRELYAGIDAARLAPAHAALDSGLGAFAEGDLAGMREKFEAVLLDHPLLERRSEMGPGFAALAAERLEAGDVDEATALLRRALALAPEAPDARRWEAELRWLALRPELARGVADVEEVRAVLTLDPEHAPAAEALATLETADGGDGEGVGSWRGPLSAMLALLGVLVLLGPRLRPVGAIALDGARRAHAAWRLRIARREVAAGAPVATAPVDAPMWRTAVDDASVDDASAGEASVDDVVVDDALAALLFGREPVGNRAADAQALPDPGVEALDDEGLEEDGLDAFLFGDEPVERIIHLDTEAPCEVGTNAVEADAADADAIIDADDPELDLDSLFPDPLPAALDAADTVPGTLFAPEPG